MVSLLAVVLGLVIIAWLFGPAAPQGRSARTEDDETKRSDGYVPSEDR
jgi:hypothetical protein